MATDLDSVFLRGGEYPDHRVRDEPRAACCGDCAFRLGPPTVRPDDVTLAELVQFTDTLDGFVCHQPDPVTGFYHTCPGWSAYHERY